MITHFKIYGERCSGTNYIEQLMLSNFNIEPIEKYGNKHFFKFREFDNFESNVLFIGIVRDVHDWINSLWRCKYHLPLEYRYNLNKFLNDEFYSINEHNNNQEIIDDRYIYNTERRYKNIFELRSSKIEFLLEYMPKFVSNFILIKYEDLINDFDNTMECIKHKYNLTTKSQYFPENIYHYKKTYHLYISQDKSQYEIPIEAILQNKHFNIDTEKKIKYF